MRGDQARSSGSTRVRRPAGPRTGMFSAQLTSTTIPATERKPPGPVEPRPPGATAGPPGTTEPLRTGSRSFRPPTQDHERLRLTGLPLLPARWTSPAGRIKVSGAILRALTRLRIEL